MAYVSYSATQAGYNNLWDKMQVTNRNTVAGVANRILAHKDRYQAIEDIIDETNGAPVGVPWPWIAITHYRESNLAFDRVLHNGDRIIGTGGLTKKVPEGRGPFETFEEAAVDAMRFKKLHIIDDWPLARMLYEFERYNGFGYMGRINSPYVWSSTNLQQRGKYTSDGNYDPSHWDKQLGCAAVLKVLGELDEDVRLLISGDPRDIPDVPAPVPETGEGKEISEYKDDELVNELIKRDTARESAIMMIDRYVEKMRLRSSLVMEKESVMSEEVKGNVRHWMTFIGGVAVTLGLIEQDMVGPITDAVITVGGGITTLWGMYWSWKSKSA